MAIWPGSERRRLPSPIGLADVLFAFADLRPTDRVTREKIVGLLGFGWAEPLTGEELKEGKPESPKDKERSSGEGEGAVSGTELEVVYLKMDYTEERAAERSIRKVFISSTIALKEYRTAIVSTIRGVELEPVVRWEEPFISSRSSLDPFKELRGCDCYVGVLGERYGAVAPAQERSAVELEYDEVRRLGLPCLLFLQKSHPAVRRRAGQKELRRIEDLRRRWQQEHVVAFFSSPEDLRNLLMEGLKRLVSEDSVPAWWTAALGNPLPRESEGTKSTAIPSLLAPRRSRAILTGALAGPEEIGGLDVNRAIESMARKRPFSRLPREIVWTPRRGVQVLLDRSPSNAPFRLDQEQLIGELEDLLPSDRLQVVDFRVHPELGRVKARRSGYRGPYRPPPRGVPVLVLSTLGMGPAPPAVRAPDAGQWLELARRLQGRDSRLVALVPVRKGLWRPMLRRGLHLVIWDRNTRILDVLRERR